MNRNKKNIPKIAESELKILQYLWECSPTSSKQIHEGLSDENWSVQTVKTLLSRLVDKKAISYDVKGRSFMYYPLVKRDEYVVEKSRSLLDRMFQGSIKAMVSNLVDKDVLSEKELDELRKFLEETGRKEDG